MKITINTRTGDYKEEPTKKEMAFDEHQSNELQGTVMSVLCGAIVYKIMALGKTDNQRMRMKEATIQLFNDIFDTTLGEGIKDVDEMTEIR